MFLSERVINEYVPCWYELSWRMRKPAIILRVHRDFATGAEELLKETSNDKCVVGVLKEKFGLKNFIGSFHDNFGFDDAFVLAKGKDDFIEFVGKIPKIERLSEERCHDCDGSGRGVFAPIDWRGKCFICHGTGKKVFYHWPSVDAISASFCVFTAVAAQLSDIETSAKVPQLMTISAMIEKGPNGGFLGGEYSALLVRWLSSLPEESILEVIQAMRVTHNRMFGFQELDQSSFRAPVNKKGRLIIISPGQCCDMGSHYKKEYSAKRILVHDFDSHNVDSSAQQITLLAGLAALNDKARNSF